MKTFRRAATSARGDRVIARRRVRGIALGGAVLLGLGLMIWVSDRITLQGERTIYTVTCEPDVWEGTRCMGRLAPGDRYAFRASALRGEVIYWVRGSTEPSSTYADCKVVDRNNWTCSIPSGQKASIAFEMKKGRPTRLNDGKVIPFHDVPKWKWWLLKFGGGVFAGSLN